LEIGVIAMTYLQLLEEREVKLGLSWNFEEVFALQILMVVQP
jgi:hypothetical protein